VRDNGIGIAARYIEKVFHLDKRLRTREEFGGGSGMGLAIVRRIAERHGGSMSVESRQSEGTVLSLTLPRRVEPGLGGPAMAPR
jgi:two-component system, chemotaxis family, sensor kinase Cph1